MHVREALPKDFRYFAMLQKQAREEMQTNPDFPESFFLTPPSDKFRRSLFNQFYSDTRKGHNIFLVAEEGKRIIGYCRIRKAEIPDSELSHVGILGIRVEKSSRGHGVGTMLLKKALDASKGKFDIINLFVVNRDPNPKRLYKRFGFRTWGIAPGFVKRKGRYMDVEYMFLDLHKLNHGSAKAKTAKTDR